MIEGKAITEKRPLWLDIWAVDPGPVESGFAHIRDGVLIRAGKMANADLRLQLVAEANRAGISVMVIEGMKVPHADAFTFMTCYEIGRFVDRMEMLGVSTVMVYRHEIKKYWLDSNRGGDKEIRDALVEHYGGYERVPTGKGAKNPWREVPPAALKDVKADAWSALAIGLFAHSRFVL